MRSCTRMTLVGGPLRACSSERSRCSAFVSLLSLDPDFALDPFLVEPKVVEFFDQVKREHEPALRPLRERRRAIDEQRRLANEAQQRLLSEEQARSGPPTKVIRVQDRIYLFNW